jgi:sulfur-oxidizing protein SoxY
MNTIRRTFLKGTLAGSTVAVAVGAGLISPRQVLAAWPKEAFQAKTVPEAIKGIVGTDLSEASGAIDIKAPDIAENGAVVPVTVSSTMPGVESITLIVEKNGTPLTANFLLANNTEPNVSTRIKMGQTSNVVAVVKAGGKVYSARKEVKVTIGGCGG